MRERQLLRRLPLLNKSICHDFILSMPILKEMIVYLDEKTLGLLKTVLIIHFIGFILQDSLNNCNKLNFSRKEVIAVQDQHIILFHKSAIQIIS